MTTSPDPFEDLERVLAAAFGPQLAAEAVAGLRAAGVDPAELTRSGMIPDLGSLSPAQVMALQAQASQLMAHARASAERGEAVNWQMGRDTALGLARASDPVVTAAEAERVHQALAVADLWLDVVTELMPAPGAREAWSRADWVDRTLPTWQVVCAPVARAVVDALTAALTGRIGEGGAGPAGGEGPGLPGGSALGTGVEGVMRTLAGTVFGLQLGHAVGRLAVESVSATEVGLPLDASSGTALVPAGVASFADGLDAGVDQVRMFLALREAAAARLYAHVPWLRSQVLGALEAYAREIRIDTAALEEAVSQVDLADPGAIQQALQSGVFAPQDTPAQRQALERLETLLALVEGWVETVTFQAGVAHLPDVGALTEMWRRRRLSGSAAEQVFARLVGLELRPRRVREAARLWQRLGQEAGAEERDALWRHPDVMPTPSELASPDDFLTLRRAQADLDADIDADLAQLLDGTLGYAEGMDRHGDEQDGHGR